MSPDPPSYAGTAASSPSPNEGPSPPAPEGAGEHPSAPPRRKAIAIAAAFGAVLVVLLLLVAGILPGFTGPSPAEGLSYAEAAPMALAGIPAGFAAHPIALAAVGIDSRTGGQVNLSTVANATANCTVTELAGFPTAGLLSLPAFSGGFDTGRAPLWVFGFEAAAGGPYAVVAVGADGASALVTATGTGCSSLLTGVRPLPSQVVDSPAAASSAWNNGGSNYVGHTANVSTLTMVAEGGLTTGLLTSPLWVFFYGPCSPLSGGNVSRPAYLVGVSLSSASFQVSFTTTERCPS